MKPKAGHAPRKRLKGQSGHPLDLTPYNGKIPIVIRVVDQALAFQGWSRSARIRILRAISTGQGTSLLSEVLPDGTVGLTEAPEAPISEIRHAKRCLGDAGLNPSPPGPSACRALPDPVANADRATERVTCP